ncbi:MAG: response regulator [Hyphomicrobiales bacterium]
MSTTLKDVYNKVSSLTVKEDEINLKEEILENIQGLISIEESKNKVNIINDYLLSSKKIGKPNSIMTNYGVFLDKIPAIVHVKDKDNKFIFANSLFEKYFGYSRAGLLGRPLKDVSKQLNIDLSDNSYDSILNDIEFQGNILGSFDKEDQKYYFISNVLPVYDDNNISIGSITITWDITGIKLNEKYLKITRDKARAANDARGLFLANMSHEIRTPIYGIIGMSEILMETNMCAKQKEYLNIITSSGQSLLKLINDILDFSKIEAGKIDLSSESFNIKTVINDVSTVLSLKAREKDIELASNIDESIPDNLIGDSIRLKQILFNLGNNAIKFTHSGNVTLSVSNISKTDDKINLQFNMRDTGIGIEKENLDHIFNTFSQVDTPSKYIYEGFGLGLAITKGLVEAMGGKISVNSKYQEGSEFIFFLSFEYQDIEKEPLCDYLESKVLNLKDQNIKILLAEDNLVNQKITKFHLENMGLNVDVAQNGKEAIDLYNSSKYHLILMDVQMPLINGFKATEKIRTLERKYQYLKTPIIALTASAMKGDKEKCIEVGMNDYLSKPFSKSDLIAKIKENIFIN